ncbi:valyl-tRNA synthetase [Heliomicrobium modesticaldum Ice1]|uniref:Valine--tRNA ligase n=1 Tax=Heliobacterium modesticaldum (strain ATCC 51547 / Ice1) TaxID=498761 RepID=B0TC05_HELMI|nr:valine--tRNA ligase [Heliomicrobium modesticaldum]ABZ85278.1 valyl-tRNA synthetase [Heliomicrobium modesticaldum Ice1]
MSEATTSGLSKTYDPKQVESKWYAWWSEKGYFTADVQSGGKAFSVVMPPPNVTGSLHLGHAMDNTLQDILSRFKRMQGYHVLWVPGTDHAGIATQAKVEEALAKEGLSKYDLGREAFLERVWDWKHQYGTRITTQLRTLGTSCDWTRERFTMDEGCSEAVQEVFIRLYEKGLIYRGNRIINWCPKCQTTISDIEVEHEERGGHLWHIRYPVQDGDGEVVVATTRPETMLGDTAVAVHPDDDRYKHLIGKMVILPILNRAIPVIADAYVDPAFGTGVVKITPAHDPNDFEVALRHNLPQITVMTKEAVMNEEAGPYVGQDRYECRKRIVKDLEAKGFLVKVNDHVHAVGQCYRCDTVVEPMVSPQWFVRMKPLAEPAMEVVKNGRLKFVPERFTKIYLGWLENIRDWCISRQLWWGHRIPVWYCDDCDYIYCGRAEELPEVCPKCGASHFEQDPDVLDTWFSSGLWPFSTLGWPEKTPELVKYYPTSVLVTGRDIIFFWVARMVFMGLEFMGDVPFREVFIHGLILDAQGRKMSKSLGNGVDPIEIIDQYGADTLRFMLVTGNTPGNDIRFHFERLEGIRNFANKIWNASRFVLMNLEGFAIHQPWGELTLADRWILSRYNRLIGETTAALERYDLGEAARLLYEFLWNEYCDWYIELAKPRLYGKEVGVADAAASRQTAQQVLTYVLRGTLQLLHPFMPFLTEEIWQQLPHHGESIMVAPWPEAEPERINSSIEEEMALVMDVIRAIRNIRAEMNVAPGKRAEVILVCGNEKQRRVLTQGAAYIVNLAGASQVAIEGIGYGQSEGAATAIVGDTAIYLPLKGLIDLTKEIDRLTKELRAVEDEVRRLGSKLNNAGFVAKAPAEVVAKEREKEGEALRKKAALEERLRTLTSLGN